MKKTLITLFTVLFCMTSSFGWSETMDELVKRDDLYYKKYTDVPFNGKITGKKQGLFENGIKEGLWNYYHDNGQLYSKGNYKNGNQDGYWVHYHENGQLNSKGDFKNGELEGSYITYYDSGNLYSKGDYKNGKREGFWIGYWDNGQLTYKGNYKNGLEEGSWVYYKEDGTVWKDHTGTFKNGVRISK
jgi:uncharacterized protein